MSHLFSTFKQRSLELRNRIAVSPMCQYSSPGGLATEWHMVHLGSRAVGGAAVVFTEATAVEERGRISPEDLGIWSEAHADRLSPIAAFVRAQGAIPGIQLAHAGRKASTRAPWKGGQPLTPEEGGWLPIVAPSAIPFTSGYATPHALSVSEIAAIVEAFAAAAKRARRAGFQVIELHSAHGYLLHQFLSPLSNQRQDEYGGSLENRLRMLVEVIRAVRGEWPEELPLWLRISATDWAPSGGWDLDQSVELARQVSKLGVDLIDCSSAGTLAKPEIPVGPGFQTPFAERIRRETSIATGAVGMITSPQQADHILRTGQADVVVLARQLLRDPYWPLRAAAKLGHEGPWPNQYLRARW